MNKYDLKANPFIEEFIKNNNRAIEQNVPKWAEERDFVKLYHNTSYVLGSLKRSHKILFDFVFATLQDGSKYNATTIEMSYKNYVIHCNLRHIDALSKVSFHHARNELEKNGVIASAGPTGFYYFNINLFFNGDRFQVAKDYIGIAEKAQPKPTLRKVEKVEVSVPANDYKQKRSYLSI